MIFRIYLPFCSVNNSAKKASDLILLQSYARLYYREIVDLLATVPSDLLLLFKTNDCLRHLDKILDTPVNSTAGSSRVFVLFPSLNVVVFCL